ncbi:MAG: hypothetical protein IJZ66_06485, partial [Oscillibacter sp.]|nr:hypothetical protein [Oscillibacter sp.]
MFPLPRKLPRALCALSLTCAMTVSPVLATQPGASSAPADPWADLCPKVLPVKEHQEETVLSLEETPALPEVPSAVQEESVQSVQPPHYLRYTPLLLERGYSHQEIDALLAVLPSVRIPVLVRSSYSALAVELIQQEHFNSMCLERYLKYAQANPTLTAADMVTRVNIGLDNMWYSNVRFVQDPTAINALVNKYHYLRPTYTPEPVPMSSWYA